MLRFSHRRLYDHESLALSKESRPKGGIINLASCHIVVVIISSFWGAGAVSWLLLKILPLHQGEALLAGFIVSTAASTYVSVRLFRSKRREYAGIRRELEAGIVECLHLQVDRAWAVDDCSYCGRSYLLRVSPDEFVLAEVGDVEGLDAEYFPAQRMRIERLPGSKKIMNIALEGPPLYVHDLGEDGGDLTPEGVGVCEVLKLSQLPASVRAQVSAI